MVSFKSPRNNNLINLNNCFLVEIPRIAETFNEKGRKQSFLKHSLAFRSKFVIPIEYNKAYTKRLKVVTLFELKTLPLFLRMSFSRKREKFSLSI